MAEPKSLSLDDTTTRSRILNAALELFATHGYAGTSIRQLARAVGLRESSLYNHFDGKAAIYAALIDEHGPAVSADRLDSPRYHALSGDPAGFCRLYAAELLELWTDRREMQFQELVMAERQRFPAQRDHYAEILFTRELGLVTDYFRDFALRGLIYGANPRETARLFNGGLTFLRLEYVLMPTEPAPRAQIAEALDRFVETFLALVLSPRVAEAPE